MHAGPEARSALEALVAEAEAASASCSLDDLAIECEGVAEPLGLQNLLAWAEGEDGQASVAAGDLAEEAGEAEQALVAVHAAGDLPEDWGLPLKAMQVVPAKQHATATIGRPRLGLASLAVVAVARLGVAVGSAWSGTQGRLGAHACLVQSRARLL